MKTKHQLLHWSPRILCILAILFVSMFALDAFEAGKPLSDQILGFLMHMVPSFVLIAILVVAWKWELIGGLLILAIGIFFTPILYEHNYAMNQSHWMTVGIILVLTFPFVVVGVLFVVNHFVKRKLKKSKMEAS